jgi:hypothetical protein
MANIFRADKKWPRLLPLGAFLTLSATFETLLETQDSSPYLGANLADGTEVRATSLKELRADLAEHPVSEIHRTSIGVGDTSDAIIWLTMNSVGGESIGTEVRVQGQNETKVFGVCARLERSIDRTFAAVDEGTYIDKPQASPTTPEPTHVDTPASPAASQPTNLDELPASSTTPEPRRPSEPWWRDTWLVTIGGGSLSAVIAGVILYLILHH